MVKIQEIGIIENYFSKIGVAVIHITDGELSINDSIIIKGSTSNFKMIVNSMEIDRKEIEKVKSGKKVGLKVPERVRPGDLVFKE